MRFLAEEGNGRSYEALKAGTRLRFSSRRRCWRGEWLVEEPFVPVLLHPDAVALAGDMPGFGGYIASTAKPLAEVLLGTHRDHPLLARWQCGLGRAVAFTSDMYGMWSMDFLAHPGFASLWLDILSWVTPAVPAGTLPWNRACRAPGWRYPP